MNIEVVYINPYELIPYQKNAKRHDKRQIDQIIQSIKEFGFNDPIAIDENKEVIEGHGRLQAAKELGYLKVPVFYLKGLTEQQKKAYRLVHNQLTLNTGFDKETLAQELKQIVNYDMQSFSFFDDAESFFDPDKTFEAVMTDKVTFTVTQEQAGEIRDWLDENDFDYKEKDVR